MVGGVGISAECASVVACLLTSEGGGGFFAGVACYRWSVCSVMIVMARCVVVGVVVGRD